MKDINNLNQFPPILDFEASSLSDCSYPISVGLVINGDVYYWIIKPKQEWIDWSLESQVIHGLKRSYLVEQGIDANVVYQEVRKILEGVSTVYSDNPYWERRWLNALGHFEVEVADVKALVPDEHQSHWQEVFQKQYQKHNLTPHRADHDALAISLTLQQLAPFDNKINNP